LRFFVKSAEYKKYGLRARSPRSHDSVDREDDEVQLGEDSLGVHEVLEELISPKGSWRRAPKHVGIQKIVKGARSHF
jgi:hypothetical protein